MTPPQIFTVGWIPINQYPLVPSSVPRQGEPVSVIANVSDELGGSGVDSVRARALGSFCDCFVELGEVVVFVVEVIGS